MSIPVPAATIELGAMFSSRPQHRFSTRIAGIVFAVLIALSTAQRATGEDTLPPGKADRAAADEVRQWLRQGATTPMPGRAIVAAAHYFTLRDQPDPALALYHRYLRDYRGGAHEARVLLAAGILHCELRQFRDARQLLTRFRQVYPHHPAFAEATANLAYLAEEEGRRDDALRLWQQLFAREPVGRFWPLAAQRVARDLLRQQAYEDAARIADRLVAYLSEEPSQTTPGPTAVRGDLPAALYLQAQILIAQQRWRPAQSPLMKLSREFPASPLTLPAEFWLAEAHFRLGDLATAGDRFDRLARMLPGRDASWIPTVTLRQCQLACHRGEWTKSLELAAALRTSFPNFPRTFEVDYCIGRAHAGRGEFAAARTAYDRVIASFPEAAETAAMAQWMIGESYLHQDRYPQAIDAYQRVAALGAYPEWEARAQLQMGKCYERLGQWRQAAATYEQAIDRYPSSGVANSLAERLRVATARQGGVE